MAAAELATLSSLGARCSEHVTLTAWDASALRRITDPTLTAMSHDVGDGAEIGTRLFDLLDGATPAAHLYSTPELLARQSSAPPPVP